MGTEGSQRKAPRTALDGQIAESDAQRMSVGQLIVAVAHDQEHRDLADPSREKAQQIEGGLVGPMHVLDDDDRQRSRLAQLGQERVEELLPGRVCPAQRVQAAVYLLRDVEERTERPGREHAVAGARQKA